MSVRATGRLIGDMVTATGLKNSPFMIVQSVDEESKMITTVWFSDRNEYQEGDFPASALDRVETGNNIPAKTKKPTAKGRKKKAVK